jgi:hypothetical protein
MSDLTVANSDIENHGVESSWAAPAGLTTTARDGMSQGAQFGCGVVGRISMASAAIF